MPTFCKLFWFESFRYTVVPFSVSPYILSGGKKYANRVAGNPEADAL